MRGSSLALRFLRLRLAGEGREKGAPSEDSGLGLPSLELVLEAELEQERAGRGGAREAATGARSEEEEDGGWQEH